jgi:hypothetical protein
MADNGRKNRRGPQPALMRSDGPADEALKLLLLHAFYQLG